MLNHWSQGLAYIPQSAFRLVNRVEGAVYSSGNQANSFVRTGNSISNYSGTSIGCLIQGTAHYMPCRHYETSPFLEASIHTLGGRVSSLKNRFYSAGKTPLHMARIPSGANACANVTFCTVYKLGKRRASRSVRQAKVALLFLSAHFASRPLNAAPFAYHPHSQSNVYSS